MTLALLGGSPVVTRQLDPWPPDDLTTAAEVGAQRFLPIAEHARLHLEHSGDGATLALVAAPADWIDRIIGVLLDNACRYTPAGGTVSISCASAITSA